MFMAKTLNYLVSEEHQNNHMLTVRSRKPSVTAADSKFNTAEMLIRTIDHVYLSSLGLIGATFPTGACVCDTTNIPKCSLQINDHNPQPRQQGFCLIAVTGSVFEQNHGRLQEPRAPIARSLTHSLSLQSAPSTSFQAASAAGKPGVQSDPPPRKDTRTKRDADRHF